MADIAECALFVALMAVGAYVKIPFYPQPLTLQTSLAVLSGLLLGWRKGVIAMSVYMLTGLIGVPVFAQGGGFSYVFNVTFGYILGFIAASGVGGAFYGKPKKLWQTVALALLAMLADYVIGVAYFYCAWLWNGNPAETLAGLNGVIVTANLSFIPKDMALSIIAAVVARAVAPAIGKRRAVGAVKK